MTSKQGTQMSSIKTEPLEHEPLTATDMDCRIKEEIMNLDPRGLHEPNTNVATNTPIKTESDEHLDPYVDTLDSKGVSLGPAAFDTGLYEDHHIKEEIVVGPTVLHKPIINCTDALEKSTKNHGDCIIFDNDSSSSFSTERNPKAKSVGSKKKNISQRNHKIDRNKTQSDFALVCDYCQNIYKSKQILMTHIKEHLKSNGYCKICNQIYVNKGSLKVHMNIHIGKKEKCNICAKTFSIITNLRKHMKQFHNTEKPSFVCDICKKVFQRKDYLVNHIRAVHPDENKPFYCECGKSYSDRSKCARHKKNCKHLIRYKGTLKSGEKFRCKICHKGFRNYQRLKRHLNYHRRNIQGTARNKYYCDYCSKCFDRKDRLIGHINKNHIAVPLPHLCEICGKTYALKNTLEKHLITHTGKFPYNCKYCKLTYQSKWGQLNHEKKCSVQTNYGNLKCKKYFKTNSNSITCLYQNCNLEFVLMSSFVRHWNRYHGSDTDKRAKNNLNK